nr:CAZy families GH18 protein [uncultured Bacteroides sp.]
MLLASCLDVENKEIDHIGGYNTLDNEESEQYYADLRAWKETAQNYGRPVSFGWFSNWSPEGAIRKGYLSSLPDSIDMISIWSDPFDLNDD